MIDGIPMVNIGATGLLALVFLLVITDKLVWYKRLQVVQKQLEVERALNLELAKQNTMMLGSAIPTVNSVLSALHRAAEGENS